jgi:hypothetical protein
MSFESDSKLRRKKKPFNAEVAEELAEGAEDYSPFTRRTMPSRIWATWKFRI